LCKILIPKKPKKTWKNPKKPEKTQQNPRKNTITPSLNTLFWSGLRPLHYKTYGLVPGGFAPLTPLGASHPDPRNLCCIFFYFFYFFYFFLFFLIIQNIWMMLFRRLEKFWKINFFGAATPPHAFFQKKLASYIHTDIQNILVSDSSGTIFYLFQFII